MTRLSLVAALLLDEAIEAAGPAQPPGKTVLSRVQLQLRFVDAGRSASYGPVLSQTVVGRQAASAWLASIDREVKIDLAGLSQAQPEQIRRLELTVLRP